MKLLIKLYKPDGTCEEIRKEVNMCPCGMTGCHLPNKELEEEITSLVITNAHRGGRIEIAPIIE